MEQSTPEGTQNACVKNPPSLINLGEAFSISTGARDYGTVKVAELFLESPSYACDVTVVLAEPHPDCVGLSRNDAFLEGLTKQMRKHGYTGPTLNAAESGMQSPSRLVFELTQDYQLWAHQKGWRYAGGDADWKTELALSLFPTCHLVFPGKGFALGKVSLHRLLAIACTPPDGDAVTRKKNVNRFVREFSELLASVKDVRKSLALMMLKTLRGLDANQRASIIECIPFDLGDTLRISPWKSAEVAFNAEFDRLLRLGDCSLQAAAGLEHLREPRAELQE